MPTITLNPVAGCYVWEGATQVAPYQPTDPIMTNYGSTGLFLVGTEGGKNSADSIALLLFDLGGSTGAIDPSQRSASAATGVIPLAAKITRIQLRLWITATVPTTGAGTHWVAMSPLNGYSNYLNISFSGNRWHHLESSWNFKSTFSGSTGFYWFGGVGTGPTNGVFDYSGNAQIGATGATGAGYWYTIDSLQSVSATSNILNIWEGYRKRWPAWPNNFTLTANYDAYPHNLLGIHIRKVAAGGDFRFWFYSHKYQDPAYRPQLIIDYIVPSMFGFFNNPDRIE